MFVYICVNTILNYAIMNVIITTTFILENTSCILFVFQVHTSIYSIKTEHREKVKGSSICLQNTVIQMDRKIRGYKGYS